MKAQVRNSGDAHAEPGGLAVTGVLVGDVYLSRPAATARSSYRYQVEQVFPWDLVGREDELAELARFCKAAEGPAYQWWQGPAWAGKSALMAWFVRHPPPGVRLVSFFVTARWFGQSDWTAFLRVVVEQLAEAAGQPMPDLTAEATPAGVFHRLLKAAAASCSQAGERLVLVVDGLDEDRGVTAGPGEHSIAALLPANPPPGVRVLVSGRPDRPVPRDVPSSHPLRSPDVVRPLAVSAQARVIRDDAERELDHLLDDGGPGHDLVGFVATAGGGLTTGDLAELTVLPERTVVRTLRAVTGRTFQRRREGWSTGDVYVLAHEELQRAAVENLGAGERARYLVRLHAWADRYRAAGWPQGTPEYLLRGYVRLLHSQGDLARMTGLATDRARLDRMLDVAGGDAVAFAEIALAQGTVCAQDDPDVAAMLALAASRYRLFLRSSRIPASLPSAWAAVGNMERARTLARSIMSWGGLGGVDVRAIRPLAEMLAEAGDFDGAETFVREEGLSWWLDLAPLLAGLVAAGRYDRVEALAVDIPGWFPDLSAVLADAFVAAGELDRAQRAVRSIDDPEVLALPVVRVARALAQADRTQEARSLAAWAADVFTPGSGPEAAASEEERAEQIRLLAVVATAMVAADDGDNARRLAARIEEFGYGGKNNRLHALARLLPLWRDLGEPGEVARIRNLVERELHGGGYLLTDYAAPGLVAMVRGLIELGDLDEARRVLRPAWDGALRNLERRYPFLGSGPLLDLMRVLPDLGEHERLDGIVHEIDDQEYRDEALEVRAELHAAEEAFEQACVTGRLIADPVRQEGLLSRLVPRLIEAQEFDLVESVLSALSDPSHREQARDALAEALAASGAWDRAAALVELVPWHRRAEPLLHLANLAPDEDKPVWGRRALAALEESDAHWPEVLRLVLTAEALAAAREPEAASRTADEAGELLRTLLKLPPRLRLSRWTELLGAAARSLGDPVRGLAYAHEAGALADSLPDVAERASALEELAGTLLDVGLADEGAAVAERIPDDQMRSALLTRVFAEALASGATDRAERYAQPAFDAAQAIHHPWAQAQALAGLAAVARDAGWLADGAVIAGAIEEPGARTAALAEVVHAQARAGEGEGARALVAEAEAAA
ncbi:MAG: NACHT domain-containing protein, partial [Streptomyces sp.]|nr:NACHT domain-containing protein [Streptomyces sp.]